jgi:hypothetical protein
MKTRIFVAVVTVLDLQGVGVTAHRSSSSDVR